MRSFLTFLLFLAWEAGLGDMRDIHVISQLRWASMEDSESVGAREAGMEVDRGPDELEAGGSLIDGDRLLAPDNREIEGLFVRSHLDECRLD